VLLKKGGLLLKHCRHGKPHCCYVQLSHDDDQLTWVSASGKPRALSLAAVSRVVEGQKTAVFRHGQRLFLSVAHSHSLFVFSKTAFRPEQCQVCLFSDLHGGRRRALAGPRVQGAALLFRRGERAHFSFQTTADAQLWLLGIRFFCTRSKHKTRVRHRRLALALPLSRLSLSAPPLLMRPSALPRTRPGRTRCSSGAHTQPAQAQGSRRSRHACCATPTAWT